MPDAHGGEGQSTPSVRVLIVDDDEVICRQMAAGLAAVGYQVMTAYDGRRAIAHTTETPPDVAIVDLEMPTSGLEVIRHLKQLAGPAVHVIVMTGHDDEASRSEAFEAGTDDYVVKPARLSELKRRLAAALLKQRAFVEVRVAKEVADRRMTFGAEANALLAHDLNNGLAVALSSVQFLREELAVDHDQADAFEALIRSLKRMSGLVANFVDIARFEDAAVKPIVTRTKVFTLLETALDVGAPSINRGVTTRVDCPRDLEARLDVALIERVLHNLVGNAARYCDPAGSIIISGRPWNDPGSVEIAVTNTGPLLPETLRPSLFGKYVHGDTGRRGLGLYFCRLVAEAHGGRIDYEPSRAGPSFVLRLPGHD